MVHDYITVGLHSRMSYARATTIFTIPGGKSRAGHWPPFSYVVQAAWTLLFTTSRTSVILLMAAITALLATILCEVLRSGPRWRSA